MESLNCFGPRAMAKRAYACRPREPQAAVLSGIER